MAYLYKDTIKEFRKREKFTQGQLAKMALVGTSTVCRAEKGAVTEGTQKIIKAIIRHDYHKRMISRYENVRAMLREEPKIERVKIHRYDTKNTLWDKIKKFVRKVLF